MFSHTQQNFPTPGFYVQNQQGNNEQPNSYNATNDTSTATKINDSVAKKGTRGKKKVQLKNKGSIVICDVLITTRIKVINYNLKGIAEEVTPQYTSETSADKKFQTFLNSCEMIGEKIATKMLETLSAINGASDKDVAEMDGVYKSFVSESFRCEQDKRNGTPVGSTRLVLICALKGSTFKTHNYVMMRDFFKNGGHDVTDSQKSVLKPSSLNNICNYFHYNIMQALRKAFNRQGMETFIIEKIRELLKESVLDNSHLSEVTLQYDCSQQKHALKRSASSNINDAQTVKRFRSLPDKHLAGSYGSEEDQLDLSQSGPSGLLWQPNTQILNPPRPCIVQ